MDDWSRRAVLASLGALAGCSAPRADTDDRVERLPDDDPALAWGVRFPGETVAGVARHDDRVYVGTGTRGYGVSQDLTPRGALYALDDEGTPLWDRRLDSPVDSAPFVSGGSVYAVAGYQSGFGGYRQRLLAFGPDGTRRWETAPEASGTLVPVAARNGTVFAGTADDTGGPTGDTLLSFAPDGAVRWRREAGNASRGALVDGLLVYDMGRLAFAAFDPADGAKAWQVPGTVAGGPKAVTVVDGRCFGDAPEADGFVAYRVEDGSVAWRHDGFTRNLTALGDAAVVVNTEEGIAAVNADGSERWTDESDVEVAFAAGESLYAVGVRTVRALDPETGAERWQVPLPGSGGWPGPTAFGDGVLLTRGTADGDTLIALDDGGEERWRYTVGSLRGLTVAADRAYVTTVDGRLLALG